MRLAMPLLLLGSSALALSPADVGAQKKRHDPDLITAEEIATASDAQTAHDLVRKLRNRWLRTRPGNNIITAGSQGVMVYVNMVRRGPVEELERIPAAGIVEIRFLNARDATTRFGTGHTDGAILVTFKAGG